MYRSLAKQHPAIRQCTLHVFQRGSGCSFKFKYSFLSLSVSKYSTFIYERMPCLPFALVHCWLASTTLHSNRSLLIHKFKDASSEHTWPCRSSLVANSLQSLQKFSAPGDDENAEFYFPQADNYKRRNYNAVFHHFN